MNIEELLRATDGVLKKEESISGVIKYTEDIYASYFLEENEVKSIQIFATSKVGNSIQSQISHATKLIETFQNIAISVCDIEKEVVNQLIKDLGLFDKSFIRGRQQFLFDYLFKAEATDGLILLTIAEL